MDGSENDLVIIHGIEGYTLPKPVGGFYLKSSDDESDDSDYSEESIYDQVGRDESVKIEDDEERFIIFSVLFVQAYSRQKKNKIKIQLLTLFSA